jgi:hypothetical protein
MDAREGLSYVSSAPWSSSRVRQLLMDIKQHVKCLCARCPLFNESNEEAQKSGLVGIKGNLRR